jgi:hypothetical protein
MKIHHTIKFKFYTSKILLIKRYIRVKENFSISVDNENLKEWLIRDNNSLVLVSQLYKKLRFLGAV